MINLIETPQRADIKAEYNVDGDVLTVKIGDVEEIFDFTGFEEGIAEEIIAEELPINPIVSAEKIGDVVNVKVIRFYGEDEKHLFEGYYLQPIYGENQPSLYKPKWDGEKWIEGATQEEINQLLNKPVEPTENDILRDYILELEYRLILLELEL